MHNGSLYLLFCTSFSVSFLKTLGLDSHIFAQFGIFCETYVLYCVYFCFHAECLWLSELVCGYYRLWNQEVAGHIWCQSLYRVTCLWGHIFDLQWLFPFEAKKTMQPKSVSIITNPTIFWTHRYKALSRAMTILLCWILLSCLMLLPWCLAGRLMALARLVLSLIALSSTTHYLGLCAYCEICQGSGVVGKRHDTGTVWHMEVVLGDSHKVNSLKGFFSGLSFESVHRTCLKQNHFKKWVHTYIRYIYAGTPQF